MNKKIKSIGQIQKEKTVKARQELDSKLDVNLVVLLNKDNELLAVHSGNNNQLVNEIISNTNSFFVKHFHIHNFDSFIKLRRSLEVDLGFDLITYFIQNKLFKESQADALLDLMKPVPNNYLHRYIDIWESSEQDWDLFNDSEFEGHYKQLYNHQNQHKDTQKQKLEVQKAKQLSELQSRAAVVTIAELLGRIEALEERLKSLDHTDDDY